MAFHRADTSVKLGIERVQRINRLAPTRLRLKASWRIWKRVVLRNNELKILGLTEHCGWRLELAKIFTPNCTIIGRVKQFHDT